MKINIEDIKIPPSWDKYSEVKFNKKEKLYEETGSPGEIIIDNNNMLVDGYISYLIYKKHGIKEIEVFSSSEERKLYVYGIHPNSPYYKEYMWEVPKKMTKDFLNKVKPESKIYCNTKFGVAPVIVKRIIWNRGDLGACLVNNY